MAVGAPLDGHGWAKKAKCRAVAHFNGEIGGFGINRVKGNLGPHDDRLKVVGGTRDFNGVAGKMLLDPLGGNKNRLHFDLVP